MLYPQEVHEQVEGHSQGLPTHEEQEHLKAQGSVLSAAQIHPGESLATPSDYQRGSPTLSIIYNISCHFTHLGFQVFLYKEVHQRSEGAGVQQLYSNSTLHRCDPVLMIKMFLCREEILKISLIFPRLFLH